MTSTSSAPVTTAPECCAGGKRVARVAHRRDKDDLAEDTGHGPGDVQDPSCRSSRLVLSYCGTCASSLRALLPGRNPRLCRSASSWHLLPDLALSQIPTSRDATGRDFGPIGVTVTLTSPPKTHYAAVGVGRVKGAVVASHARPRRVPHRRVVLDGFGPGFENHHGRL